MPSLSSLSRITSPAAAAEQDPAFRALRLAKNSSLDLLAHLRVPPLPREAIVPLEAASEVLLIRSRSPWYFSAQTYAQESGFAHAMAARGRTFAITTEPDRVFGKSVMWFMPEKLIAPRLWDQARQVQEFAAGLERQGNRVFCSSEETAYWENKVHMHRRLEAIGAPAPETRMITAENWQTVSFDIEPVLIKQEHSRGSAGIHHFARAEDARSFVAGYEFRPTETLLMQALVPGATRDLRITMVGSRTIPSASYWRVKSPEALAAAEWTSTATTHNSAVEHANVPASAATFAAEFLRELNVRTAGVDLMWADDDLSREPLILEFSPYYQPNPPKPARYASLSYREWKKGKRFAPEGYLAQQFETFRDIGLQIIDQGLF